MSVVVLFALAAPAAAQERETVTPILRPPAYTQEPARLRLPRIGAPGDVSSAVILKPLGGDRYNLHGEGRSRAVLVKPLGGSRYNLLGGGGSRGVVLRPVGGSRYNQIGRRR